MGMLPYSDILARVSQIESLVSQTVPQVQQTIPTIAPTTSFAQTLAAATDGTMTYSTTPSASGSNVLAAAETQVGVSEQPPGSNDGPQIATYRTAVAGAQAGEPWCAYFASWAAAQAGTPLGANGEGLGSVAQITSWAQQTGRYMPAGSVPQSGDLILFGDHHVGIVESVNSDGSLNTVEGNYENAVSRVHRMPGEATGFVRLGA
jgi:CHAP domain